LEDCDGCDLVKYCGDKCREVHREEHEEECKKRAKKLHDRKLFSQPDETHLGECPLCFLPLPLHPRKSAFLSCCSQRGCTGCVYAHTINNRNDNRCPFCREPGTGVEETRKRLMKRVKANDPAALCQLGGQCRDKGDYDGAFEYLTKAAELGDAEAHCRLGVMYWKGEGVETNKEKAVYHYEKAAMGGHPYARHELARYEERNGNIERSVKHLIIAANLGNETSMKTLWAVFKVGNITKEDLDTTLRAHQAAIDEMKSEQRDAAEVALQGFR
jgi:tetratricopeptide (TPR) repeat protein